eukprot:Skav213656  [mRNA]  locus=scaffold2012:416109:417175:- [translate_table: standard]
MLMQHTTKLQCEVLTPKPSSDLRKERRFNQHLSVLQGASKPAISLDDQKIKAFASAVQGTKGLGEDSATKPKPKPCQVLSWRKMIGFVIFAHRNCYIPWKCIPSMLSILIWCSELHGSMLVQVT